MPSMKAENVPDDDHGLEHASLLVKSIFHQITEGDAPSSNFENHGFIHNHLTGSSRQVNGNGAGNHGGGSSLFPAKVPTTNRPYFPNSSSSNLPTTSDNNNNNTTFSLHDFNDAVSTTASERSISSHSHNGQNKSPFGSPTNLSSRFPPRPPSTRKKDLYDNTNTASSVSDRLTVSTHSTAPKYGIGPSLMGTMALADLCEKTMEASSRKEGERNDTRGKNNKHFLSGKLPPPPLSMAEDSTAQDEEPKLSSILGEFYDQSNTTPRASNGGNDAPSFETNTTHGNNRFSCGNEMETEHDRPIDITGTDSWESFHAHLNTSTSLNSVESGSFGLEDVIAEEGESKYAKDTHTTPVANKTAPPLSRTAASNKALSPLSVQRALSSEGAIGSDTPGQKRRITMFGSEYARILSSSKTLFPSSNDSSPHLLSSARKVKRSSAAVSNKIKARISSSVSVAQSYASSAKESVESQGSALLTLDECPNAVATAAITDVIVTFGSDVPPRGYYRAFQLGEELTKNMVPGKKRRRLFLNVKKEPNWDRAVQRPCVTAFCIIYPDRNEFVPPGFSVVRHYQPGESSEGGSKKKSGGSNNDNSGHFGSAASPAANINVSTSGERVYLCYRRSREGNPITGITCLRPSKGDLIAEGYTVLERTPRNYLADMAAKSDQPLFLAYRQRLANLECLRPLPLVLSVLNSRTDSGRKELKAYYCTGGTIVSSDVGRYHIMDRSTHSLLSSSSAQTRLNVIQSSRKDSETAVPAWVSSTSSHSSSGKSNGNRHRRRGTGSSFGSFVHGDDSSVGSGMCQLATDSFDTSLSKSPSQASMASTITKNSSPGISSLVYSHSDDALQTSLDAMHFIPPIECANSVHHVKDAADSESFSLHHQSLLQSRVAIITPILTSCYSAQGAVALMAVEGLISLLNDTNFFSQDVKYEDGEVGGIMESSEQLTILNLVIQVVCDVATSTARETYFPSCVHFVSDAVRYARGMLNDRTIGFVLRFYLFVFYFGASVPAHGWPFEKEWHKSKMGISDDFLLADSTEPNTGGAPQAAAVALKEFVSIMLSRIGTGLEKSLPKSFQTARDDESSSSEQSHTRNILSVLVENAMNRVDIANYTQLAMYQIHRSGGSELFWHDMISSIGEGLFGQNESMDQGVIHSNIISFAVLASFVKISSAKVRRAFNNTEPVPRDVASKLLSFELLLHFIKMWHVAVTAELTIHDTEEINPLKEAAPQKYNEMESAATMIYVVRRLVVPTLLSNTSAAIEDCRVYRRILRIISYLWCNPHYRRQMKIDLAVLIEHFVLKVLCLGPQVHSPRHPTGREGGMPSLLHQQLDVLEEMKNWFSSDDPRNILDLYIYYDTQGDLLPGTYAKLMNKICEALSTLAEQCCAIINEHGHFTSINGASGSPRRSSIPGGNEMPTAHAHEAAQHMRKKAFHAIAAIAKSMMDCALKSQEEQKEQLMLASALAVADSYVDDNSSDRNKDNSLGVSPQMSPGTTFGGGNIADYWKMTVSMRRASLNPALPKAIREIETSASYSTNRSVGEDSRQSQLQHKQESFDVAFKLIASKGLKKGIDYLIAAGQLSPSPRHISAFLKIYQTSIEADVLGEYLGEGGIDGADSIDFWNLIRFNYSRATSFVGMSIEQALRHFLTNCGFRLPGEAQKIDRIISTFSQCYWEDNAGDLQKCPFQDQDTVFLVSFAIIMLNTDLHKSHASKGKAPKRMTRNEFIANLRGVYNGVDKYRNYIYAIYDSIESTPIAISNFLPQTKTSKPDQDASCLPFEDQTDIATSVQSWVKSVKSVQDLLRTVAVRHEKLVEHDDEIFMEDMTSQMFSANWHHIHGVINATIDNAHLDRGGLDCCIDVLEYSLCTASFLDMPVERSAFSKLLGRVNRFNDLKVNTGARKGKPNKENSKQAHFEDVDQVRSLTKELHESLHVDTTKIATMKQVASRIRNGHILLNDMGRTFVREGDLIKRHQLVGRSSTYRFFLFSDTLAYGHKSSHGDYKVHEELPLHLMKIEDSGTKQNSFHIQHPNKSFLVVASCKGEKQQWIYDINNSIRREVKRKAKIEKSRIEAGRRARV